MAENELLKAINKELKITSLEKSEKERAKKEQEEELADEKDLSDDELAEIKELEDAASEETDDVIHDKEANILSSDPTLLSSESSVIGHNEIDKVPDKSGVLNQDEVDKTASFVDPEAETQDEGSFKVVDTSLGVFTVLNSDDKSVLLLDSNNQKIQISLEDFNNLNPFEIRDERLSSVINFKDAYNKDLEEKEKAAKEASEKQENDEGASGGDEGFDEEMTDEESFEEEETEEEGFGESFNHSKEKSENKKEQKNILSDIQKGLSTKLGVKETIRTDVRSKNRCVLAAKKAKATKEREVYEDKVRVKLRKKENVMEGIKMESKKAEKTCNKKTSLRDRKEATQPAAIYTPPAPLGGKDDDFDVNKVVTLKDGKFVLAKLEGKNKVAYLKLEPKETLLSINEIKFSLNGVKSFYESLDCLGNNCVILEKEIVMKKENKFESEEVEEIDQELDIEDKDDDVDVESDEEDVEVDVEDSDAESDSDEESDEVEEEDGEQPDSIPFSTEVNGVRYSGVLYRDDSEDDEEGDEADDDEDDEDWDEDDSDEDWDEESEDDDLILISDEEIDELDFPDGLDESVIKANASIYGNKYNVSFCDVKKECVRHAKLAMRNENFMEAWNALVRGAKSIKC